MQYAGIIIYSFILCRMLCSPLTSKCCEQHSIKLSAWQLQFTVTLWILLANNALKILLMNKQCSSEMLRYQNSKLFMGKQSMNVNMVCPFSSHQKGLSKSIYSPHVYFQDYCRIYIGHAHQIIHYDIVVTHLFRTPTGKLRGVAFLHEANSSGIQ